MAYRIYENERLFSAIADGQELVIEYYESPCLHYVHRFFDSINVYLVSVVER